MKKLLMRLAILLVGVLVILFLARNLIARKSVEVGVKTVTGFPLEIESVHISPGFGRLEVKGLHLMNPSEFSEETFIQMPEFTVDYQVGSMISGSPHINEMVLSVDQLNVVKNADGISNVQKLKGIASGDQTEEPAGEKSELKYQVDVLRIHIGTVTVKDFSKGEQPSVRSYALNIDATYENINDPSDISRLILITVMSKVGLPNIGVDMGDLTKGLGNVTGAAGEVLQGGAETIGKTGKGLFDTIKKAVPGKE